MAETLIPILIISLLIFFNGVFVAAEFSIVAAPKSRIARRAEQGSSLATSVLKILENPVKQNRYFATAQVGITLASLGLGMYGEHVLAEWILHVVGGVLRNAEATAHTMATILSVAFLTYLHVVLGEMIPKSLALQTSETTVLILNRPMVILEKLFMPLVYTLNMLGTEITSFLGVSQTENSSRLVTPEDIEYIVEESSEGGLLEPSDQLFIENILDLEERNVGQVMTPRNRICAVSINDDMENILKTVCETTKTRYPVIDESLDQITGVLHIKDIARHIIKNDLDDSRLENLVRPALFIPKSFPLDELLIRFRKEHHQIAIVLDEFGGTAGLVTLEDLVEEVVGEIQDEFDEEVLPIEELTAGVIRVQGNVILDELSQHYDLKFDSTQANTIGGYVMSLLGNIPKTNDKINLGDVEIVVESLDGLAVNSVIIHLPSQSSKN